MHRACLLPADYSTTTLPPSSSSSGQHLALMADHTATSCLIGNCDRSLDHAATTTSFTRLLRIAVCDLILPLLQLYSAQCANSSSRQCTVRMWQIRVVLSVDSVRCSRQWHWPKHAEEGPNTESTESMTITEPLEYRQVCTRSTFKKLRKSMDTYWYKIGQNLKRKTRRAKWGPNLGRVVSHLRCTRSTRTAC